ncbi:apolipoprotein N-acyltransferase [Actinorhabdospora filicis]|uniref:Apolipoprotein N-acyltransferase n=1 Tax=Actinorhabdospora filicis TaxID=1785913 RepID=A0A9W6SKY9_9ACTN|nr:hypothetical protein [Actinorhabdospora filicis]GLZ77908.1 apolipoprotein N-acyltransferase [Actinorhabdospora filicis]
MAWKPEPRRIVPPLTALAVSAALFYLGTGFTPIGLLAWLAPLPVLLVAPRVRGLTATAIAFAAWFLGSANSWGYYLDSFDVPLPIAIPIVVGQAVLFAGGVALYRALLTAGRPLPAALAPPALWAGAIFLIGMASPVGVIGPLATSQADIPVVLRLASLTGGTGIEFLVLFIPCGLAAALTVRKGRALTAIVTAAVLAAALGYGLARPLAGAGPGRTVALVARDHSPWAPDVTTPEGREILAAYTERIAALPDDVDLAVVPEGAFTVHAPDLPALTEPLRATGVDVAIGVIYYENDRKYNTTLAVPADGGPPAMYRMWHANPSGGLTAGTDLVMLPGTGDVALGMCRDVNFPDPAGAYADAGAKSIVLPGRDGDSNGRQHAIAAVIRGVEHGMSVAWSADQGVVLLADAHGRILAEGPTDGTGFTIVSAVLPDGPGATPYTRLGDWFGWTSAALALALLVAPRWLTRRRTPGSAAPGSP